MSNVVQKFLNPNTTIFELIGGLAQEPKFLKKNDVKITAEDAVTKLQRMALGAIVNLAFDTNYNPMSSLDVDNYIHNYPGAYEMWIKNKGPQHLSNAIKSSKVSHLRHDYIIVKKYAYLRKFYTQGFDIKDVFDYESRNIDVEVAKLAKTSVDQITNYFTEKANHIKKSWTKTSNNVQSFEIGDGITDLVKHLADSPTFGYPFQNGYYNQLFGGMKKSKLLIRSTITGGGKTRQALKDFCHVAFSEVYNNQQRRWINTGYSTPALFISTELNKEELQKIVLAYLTGISSKSINFGAFNDRGKELINHAIRVIRKTHFYFEYVEDFNTNDIENLIDEYVRKGVKYVDFDYIQATPSLMSQLKQSYGYSLREDQALVFLSKELKTMAEKYNVFIMSATQVNGFYAEDERQKSRTEYTLRGGKSIADKVDYGIIISRVTKTDKNMFAKSPGLSRYHPNYAHWVYKNRNGESSIVVWTKFNFSNLREVPLCVTDYNLNIKNNIKPMEIAYD